MNCERCGQATLSYAMSYFNTEEICDKCDDEERAHPMYEYARRVELRHVEAGNYNFPGIGLPEDLRKPKISRTVD